MSEKNTASEAPKKIEFNLDTRPTKTITLPSFPWSSVTVYTSLTVNEQRAIESEYKTENNTVDPLRIQELGLDLVAKSIKSWNFTKDGQDLPVSAEILWQMPTVDFLVMNEAVTGRKLTHKNDAGETMIGSDDEEQHKKKS